MGASLCQCSKEENPNDLFKTLLSLKSIKQLTYLELNSILRTRSGDNLMLYNSKSGYISHKMYKQIINGILADESDTSLTRDDSTLPKENPELIVLTHMLNNLYNVINFSISKDNLFSFALCLFPIVDTKNLNIQAKVECLFDFLRKIKITYNMRKDVKKLKNSENIIFGQFCEAFLFYISVCISGYTKSLIQAIEECNYQTLYKDILMELKACLNDVFTFENITKYYSVIIHNYVKNVELANNGVVNFKLAEHELTLDDFKEIMRNSSHLLNLCSLRDDFLQFFAKKKKN